VIRFDERVARAQDPAAALLTELDEQHYRSLLRLAVLCVDDRALAEDVVTVVGRTLAADVRGLGYRPDGAGGWIADGAGPVLRLHDAGGALRFESPLPPGS